MTVITISTIIVKTLSRVFATRVHYWQAMFSARGSVRVWEQVRRLQLWGTWGGGGDQITSEERTHPIRVTPAWTGCGILASNTRMQWPRVDALLNWVGAMAFRPFARLNVSVSSVHVLIVRRLHQH